MYVWDPPTDAQVMGPDTCSTPVCSTRAQASRPRQTTDHSLFFIPVFFGFVTSILSAYQKGTNETRDEIYYYSSSDGLDTPVSPSTSYNCEPLS